MPDIESIAQDLRSVYEKNDDLWGFFSVLVPCFADKVKLSHLPVAYPMDGLLDGATLAEQLNPQSSQIMKELMPDYREVVKSFSIAGQAVIVFVYMTGTLADGAEVRVPATFVFSFADGRLVQIDIHSDPADYGPFINAMAAAGHVDAPAT